MSVEIADTLLFVAIVVGSIVLLAIRDARDARKNRFLRENRPIEEQIREIHDGAVFEIEKFTKLLARIEAEHKDQSYSFWIPPVVDFNRRLEILASSPTASLDDTLQLAEESAQHVRENKLKGIHVGEQARRLAVLLQKRAASSNGVSGIKTETE